MTLVIRTERLLLQPYVPEDEEDFVRLFSKEEVSRWMGDGSISDEDTRALFARLFTDVYPTSRFDVWAVREGDRLVGHAEIKDTTDIDGYEIIYALSPEVWGGGLGTELARSLVSYGFEELGLSEVHATVALDNSASLALLEKVGFARVKETTSEEGGITVLLTCSRVSFESPGDSAPGNPQS
jgi:RimJ/RimL family protein N-acetyltransferase